MFAAAHCFKAKGFQTSLKPEYLQAILGRFNLSDFSELESKSVLVQEIILHPDWNIYHEQYDADIAIVVLTQPVEFSTQIQPVCLPEATNQYPVGPIRGTVTGWGKRTVEAEHDETPNNLEMPVVNASSCYTRNYKLARFSSLRTFCAGFENEERGSCSGDSGGGFFIKNERDYTWMVQGIVSSSLAGDKYRCDVNTFGIYTNVGYFREWIDKVEQTINKSQIKLDISDDECGNHEEDVETTTTVTHQTEVDNTRDLSAKANNQNYTKKSLIVVFDGTNSMVNDLIQMQAAVREIVQNLSVGENKSIKNYVLTVFRDPSKNINASKNKS